MASEPWFVLYKGPMQYKFKPCSAAGWLPFAAFMLVAMAPVLIAPLLPEPFWGLAIWLATFPVAFLILWRFARARSRVIDLGAVETDWAEFEAWKKRGKR
jgi:hypothetical protein